MTGEQEMQGQAVLWLLRVNDAAFVDWAEFEKWMAADPANAATYWALATRDADTVDTWHGPTAKPGILQRWNVRRPAWTIAAAAMAAVAIGSVALHDFGAPRPLDEQGWTLETPPGIKRAVRLRDGTRIALNGSTRVVFDRAAPRTIKLDRGQASFVVRHDPLRPFIVIVGAAEVRDVGTVFDVVRLGSGVRVAVAEGAIAYRRTGKVVELAAGQVLSDVAGAITVKPVPIYTVGSWRSGRLNYIDAPLADVAGDIDRALGVTTSLAPSAAALRFSGSIRMRGTPEVMRPSLQALLGVRIQQTARGWRMQAPADTR